MFTNTGKRRWLEGALPDFKRERPDVDVQLMFGGSSEAARNVVAGTMHPTIFNPTESDITSYLASEWREKRGGSPFAGAPRTLVRSPMVFLGWRSRMEAIAPAGFSWTAVARAQKELKGSGAIRFGHTDPTKGATGLDAILLMGLELFGRPSLSLDDVRNPRFAAFVDRLESGLSQMLSTNGALARYLSQWGPGKLDFVFTYESIATEVLEAASKQWGEPLRVVYPRYTLWADNPAVVLKADWVTPQQREAAEAFLAFLHTPAIQARALLAGFRSEDAAATATSNPANPFWRLQAYGIRKDLPPDAAQLDDAVLRAIIELASRVPAVRQKAAPSGKVLSSQDR